MNCHNFNEAKGEIISIFIHFLYAGYLFRNFHLEIYILIKLKCAHFHPWYQFTMGLTKFQMLQTEYCEQHLLNKMLDKTWTESSRNRMLSKQKDHLSLVWFSKDLRDAGQMCCLSWDDNLWTKPSTYLVYVYLLKWMPKMATISFSQNHKDSLSFVVQQSCNAI